MKITLTAPDEIKPYDSNPRHNDAAVDAVARSIQEFGFRQPVEHRWMAAVKQEVDRSGTRRSVRSPEHSTLFG